MSDVREIDVPDRDGARVAQPDQGGLGAPGVHVEGDPRISVGRRGRQRLPGERRVRCPGPRSCRCGRWSLRWSTRYCWSTRRNHPTRSHRRRSAGGGRASSPKHGALSAGYVARGVPGAHACSCTSSTPARRCRCSAVTLPGACHERAVAEDVVARDADVVGGRGPAERRRRTPRWRRRDAAGHGRRGAIGHRPEPGGPEGRVVEDDVVDLRWSPGPHRSGSRRPAQRPSWSAPRQVRDPDVVEPELDHAARSAGQDVELEGVPARRRDRGAQVVRAGRTDPVVMEAELAGRLDVCVADRGRPRHAAGAG